MADPFDAALDLLRRLPPSATATNLTNLITLRPDLEDDLLSSVDVTLTTRTCPTTNRPFLCCDYNRDGSSHRSPWSNTFVPPIDPEDAADLIPGGRVRRMEEALNKGVDVYRELYFEGGVGSAYLWPLEEGFAGVVLLQKRVDGQGEGGWDSIHVLEVNEAAGRRTAGYKLTSTVILNLGGEGLEVAGNLTRQTQQEVALAGVREAEVEAGHVVVLGRMVEEMETRMRGLLQEVYFGKARDVVGDLRSVVPLGEVEGERRAHREAVGLMGVAKR